MQIDWARVVDFIAQRDPALAASFVGVDRQRIAAVESQFGITLPSAYVDFLLTMGENSGTLEPFGESRGHAFSELLEELPSQGYPPTRLFKFSFESNPIAEAYFDTYLDLARTDGEDAPIVSFEPPLPADTSKVPDEPLSFRETLFDRICWKLDVARKDYGARIFVFADDPESRLEIKQQGTRVLTALGFTWTLPDLRRVACLSRGAMSALITDSDTSELVDFRLGGDNIEEVDMVAQQLVAVFPGADYDQPAARRDVTSEI
jgi:hypothetical protein